MENLKRQSKDYLINRYLKCLKVGDRTDAFEKYEDMLYKELNRRNWSVLYREGIRILKNNGRNQFEVARKFADEVIHGADDGYSPEFPDYEVNGRFTKDGKTSLIYFD